MRSIIQKIRSLNIYLLTGLVWLVWMLFIDSNDFFTLLRMYFKVKNLENDATYYITKIKEVKKEQRELMGSDKLLEKFAREKYLMKREGEDLFVIVDPNNEPLEK